jgi:ubiquinone/menaquinone biosynthesis C-methylase UbiE
MGDGERSAREYDAMALEYSAANLESAFNAYYERPAMIGLLGDVSGCWVLEVGCGAGPLTAWLVEHGATVTAMDVSAAMLGLARQRVGSAASFHLADVSQPLAFAADGEFDVVVASLVLHYLEDWKPVLAEFRRVLKPDGCVLFSTQHPAMDWQVHSRDDYFAVKEVTETWPLGSKEFEVTLWRRPLTEITSAVAAAGFVIDRLVEPEPVPELRERDADAYTWLRRAPHFLFFRLRPSPIDLA